MWVADGAFYLQPSATHLQPYNVLNYSSLLRFFREGCRWQMKNKTISFLLDLLCFNSLQYLLRMNLCLYFLRSKYSLYDTFFVHEVCSAQDADSFSAANNLFAPTSVSVSAMPPCPLLFIIIPLPPNQNQ